MKNKDKKINLKCPKCGDWEEISKSDYFYMTLGDVLMCTKCLDKFNERLFYGEEKYYTKRMDC